MNKESPTLEEQARALLSTLSERMFECLDECVGKRVIYSASCGFGISTILGLSRRGLVARSETSSACRVTSLGYVVHRLAWDERRAVARLLAEGTVAK